MSGNDTIKYIALLDYGVKRNRRMAVEYIIKQPELIKACEEKERGDMSKQSHSVPDYEDCVKDADKFIKYLDGVLEVLIPF